MTYASLFAGIGGFDLALNRLGHQCVYVNEWDKYAAQIYEKNFGHKPDTRDIRAVDVSEISDHDLLVGGFPCQAFSIAGKRQGFNETRGTLFFEICRIAAAKRTPYLLLENVKGLLSHDSGKTFATIIRSLDGMGYDCQWQVLNSKDFGVPQNRERVFIIGYLRGQRRPEVFPIGISDKVRTRPETTREKVYAGTLTARQFASWNGNYIKQINQPRHSHNRVYEASGISPTLNTMQGGNRQPKVTIPVLTPDRPEKRQNGRRFKEDGEPSFTLTAQDRHGIFDGIKIRKLTPIECERLQGFPDNWTQGISDSQRYKCLGNAVTVNVIYEIAKRF